MIAFGFDNTYTRLPDRFYARLAPTPVANPALVRLKAPVARMLGLDPDALTGPEGAAVFAGNAVPADADPAALAYAGHQFGYFSPQLGDGRALLLGEIVGRDGVRRDVQLKGSGPTPFSRNGDGRAALGPVLREYLISEAMAGFGIPTTRSLAAVTTGEPVYRETALPGAVLTRVAASHIRVGTFQYFAARQDIEAVRLLADYTIGRHDPEAKGTADPYRAMLAGVVARQADLVAQWLLVGFIHGVMNTDNAAVSGETIDYGPCAFMDAYDPGTVFSSIDELGRYAYANQPGIAHWNVTRLAEALLPLLAPETDAAVEIAKEVLAGFGPRFEAAYLGGLRRKIGLATSEDGDGALIKDLLSRMKDNAADFTLTFRRLAAAASGPEGDAAVRSEFTDPAAYDGWASAWRSRLAREPGAPAARRAAMEAVNPAYTPRNHVVEEALQAAVSRQDYGPFEAMLAVVVRPFEERPGLERYATPPLPDQRV
ncbi:MAG: YdiU family protein, partial [Rhodospirillales bacterium]|nr:YdiU family protein [Rhodospirillales bacterium]